MTTHAVPGEYTSEWQRVNNVHFTCPKCGGNSIEWRLWESSDGAFDDHKYRCACGHVWWVDGPDA